MVKLSRFPENRSGHKGQSLVEVAVFGSLLLLVLAYLLKLGLSYNYSQEVKMESYRRALQKASESDAAKEHVVDVRKDVLLPDPSDMFALGTRKTMQEKETGVFWSNNTQPLDYTSTETSQSVQYVFNPDSRLVSPVVQEYTTANLEPQPGGIIPGKDSILNGINNTYVVGSLAQTRVYQADPGYGPKEVMVLLNNGTFNCEDEYCKKTILGQVKYPSSRGGTQYYSIYNVTSGEVGSPPNEIAFFNPDAGEINDTLASEQVVLTDISRDSTLDLEEDASSYTSIESLNSHENLKHVIMTTGGDQGPAFTFGDAEPSKTWTTPK